MSGFTEEWQVRSFFLINKKENYANEQQSKKNVGKRGLGFGSVSSFSGSHISFKSSSSEDKIKTENDETSSYSFIIQPPKNKVKKKKVSDKFHWLILISF